MAITRRSETCRCGGSINLEGDGKDAEMTDEIWQWRTLHQNCEKSPQYYDRTGSTSTMTSFGFTRNMSLPLVR